MTRHHQSVTYVSGINRNPCVRNGPVRNGAPDTIRTCDLCLRRATLYPAELRVHRSDPLADWPCIGNGLSAMGTATAPSVRPPLPGGFKAGATGRTRCRQVTTNFRRRTHRGPLTGSAAASKGDGPAGCSAAVHPSRLACARSSSDKRQGHLLGMTGSSTPARSPCRSATARCRRASDAPRRRGCQ